MTCSYYQEIIIFASAWNSVSPYYRFALAGIEKPRVMKSDCLPAISLLEEKSPFRFSLGAIFLFLLRSSCSARTLAVNDAVPSFFIAFDDHSTAIAFGANSKLVLGAAPSAGSVPLGEWAFFLFLPEPVAFFNEWVRPSDCSLDKRSRRRSLSAAVIGRIGIILSGEYASLHCNASAKPEFDKDTLYAHLQTLLPRHLSHGRFSKCMAARY